MLDSIELNRLLDHPRTTERQKQIIQAYLDEGSLRKAAAKLGCAQSTVGETIQRARSNALKHDKNVPDDFEIKGISTYSRTETGGEWVKIDKKVGAFNEYMDYLVYGLTDQITPYQPIPVPTDFPDNLLNLFVITDYHIGMLAEEELNGQSDWNLPMAEHVLQRWIETAIARAPKAKQAILCNLGDFLHFDGAPVTSSSGHLLDAASVFPVMFDSAIRALRYCIDALLHHYESVHVISATGNHDLHSAHPLRVALSIAYENEPRLSIDMSKSPFYAFKWGKTSLFFHHGHRQKMGNVASTMAGQYPKIYGLTDHRYCHMGHYHHIKSEENNLMIVEQHRTLSPKDRYSSEGGYFAGRSSDVITYHKQTGHLYRTTISTEMLERESA